MAQSSPWETWARLPLYLSALAPLVFFREQYFPLVAPRAFFLFAVSELAFVATCWMIAFKRQTLPKMNGVPVVLAVFVFLQVVAGLSGGDWLESFWSEPARMTGVWMILHLFGFFLVMIVLLRRPRDWMRFFAWSCAVGFVVVLLDLVPGALSTFGNSTLYGTYLLFFIWMALYVLWESRTRTVRWFGAVCAILGSVSLFASDARAAQAALIGSLILAACLALFAHGKARLARGIGIAGVAALLVVFVVVSVGVFVDGSVVQESFVQETSQARLVVWDIAWSAFLDRPFLGWGSERFESVFFAGYDTCFGSAACTEDVAFDRAHNIVFEILVGSGILGLLAYVGVFLAAVAGVWRGWLLRRENSAAAIFVTSCLAAYLVQNLTGFDSVESLYLWMVVLAFAYAFSAEGKTFSVSKKLSMATAGLATVLLPVLLWFFVVEPWIGFRSVPLALQAQTMEERLGAYQMATTVSSAGLAYRRANLAHETSVMLWHVASDVAQASSAYEEVSMARVGLLATLQRSPDDLKTLLALGRLYQVEGRLFDPDAFMQAQEVLEDTMQRHPRNPHPAWALASVFLEQGRVEEAVALTQEVLDRDPRVLKAHTARLVAVKFLRDEDLLLETANESARMLPGLASQLQFIVSEDLEAQRLLFLGHFY